MRPELLSRLVCPACGSGLLASTNGADGGLRCAGCGAGYPVEGGVPRFVPPDPYGGSFGLQWNRFSRTQLDSFSGLPISRERFLAQTGWTREDLEGRQVLDAGCGAGRFAEIARSLGASVVAVDVSASVRAAWANCGASGVDVVQADLYRLPFAPGTFDFVYCLGVLQHTSNLEASVAALAGQLRGGGRLVVDVYEKSWRSMLHPKTVLRPVTTRLPSEALLRWTEKLAPSLLKVSSALGGIPVVGPVLRRAVPVANYEGVYPLSPTQLTEWAVLDTYDWLGPRWDQPQTPDALKRLLKRAGLSEISVFRAHHLTGRGARPHAPRD